MPRGMAAAARKAVEQADRDELELERTPWSSTGFVNVTKVGGKYQARLQVPGDGCGGIEKRKQCSLPGLFDTAEDAAVLQALVKKSMKERNDGNVFVPPKQNKPLKPRSKPAGPIEASPPPLQPPRSCQWPRQWSYRMRCSGWTYRLRSSRRLPCARCVIEYVVSRVLVADRR